MMQCQTSGSGHSVSQLQVQLHSIRYLHQFAFLPLRSPCCSHLHMLAAHTVSNMHTPLVGGVWSWRRASSQGEPQFKNVLCPELHVHVHVRFRKMVGGRRFWVITVLVCTINWFPCMWNITSLSHETSPSFDVDWHSLGGRRCSCVIAKKWSTQNKLSLVSSPFPLAIMSFAPCRYLHR